MQLGYTGPLQKHLGIRGVPCGAPCDPRFCWDLHVLRPNNRPSLFAVHATSAFAFLLYDPTEAEWRDIPALFLTELAELLPDEGFARAAAARYLALAGAPQVTRTHGRRPVAYLNRAVERLRALPVGLETGQREQRPVRMPLNDLPGRAAGHTGGTPREYLRRDIRDLLEE